MIEPTIFLGPPGTGKTTTLLDIVDQEMENGVSPDRIGFMTFTKRGVEEAISRAAERFGLARSKFRYFNTLHAAAFRHLGLNTSQVFTGKKIKEFGAAHGLELWGGLSSDDGTYSSFHGDDIILFIENYARITCKPLAEVLSQYDFVLSDTDRAWRIIKTMWAYKKEEGLFDFTDMLELFVKEDDPPMLEVLIIDEAQDLSELQWQMVELLARHAKRIYIAGDDDQTIFTWAGASERFISLPGNTQTLKQSYRIPRNVFQLAIRIIERIDNRRHKIWQARDAEGSVNTIGDISRLDPAMLEAENGSVMMLGRTVKMLRQKFVPYCRQNGLLYRYFENNSVKPTQAKAIEAWNSLRDGLSIRADDVVRIYDLLPSESHKKKVGLVKTGFKVRLSRIADQPEPPLLNMQQLRNEYGLLADGTWDQIFTEIHPQEVAYIKTVLKKGYSLLNPPNIHISTIHRVKGGQADNVILLSETAKPAEQFANNQDEETRVFYTGITRTKENLVIVQPDKRRYYDGLFQ